MLNLKTSTETHDKLRRLLKNLEWLNGNLANVQADYAGKWIAIAEEKVVALGLTNAEIKKQIKERYPREETLLVSVPEGNVSRPI